MDEGMIAQGSKESHSEIVREAEIRRWFRYSVFLKGLLAVLEIGAGIITMLIKPQTVLNIADLLTADELAENPHDFIASHLAAYAHQLAFAPHLLIGIFVLADGLVKLLVVVLLLKEKIWAYPLAIGVLAFFAIYEGVRFLHTQSPLLIALIVFDIIIIWLVWREYAVVRSHLAYAEKV